MKNIDLNVKIGNLELKNPVMPASGTWGYGLEYITEINPEILGAVIVKGLSLEPSKGNPHPRVVETPSGLLNAVGLENIGIKNFIETRLPVLSKFNTPVITNIYGKTESDYTELASIIEMEEKISAIEVNISCPNVKKGGLAFGTSPETCFNLVSKIRRKTTKPLIVKLTPNVTDIKPIAKSAEDAGADAVSLINTITGMVIDINTKKPMLANVTGGLSGPAIRPVALRMVYEACSVVKIPVIGIGGIVNHEDALSFIIAGASAVQVGTGNFINPKTCEKIISGITRFMKKNKIAAISDLRGTIITS
ncbi:MAG: dihydroorotate dehydrogenase [Desulfobacteraceae bacterium]|nr:dihydroorotate dehydrogenase [Desulfobacteraceae bacterium]MCB9495172.1 dihydroorotate dehydrogenase [Desulfobacteraceae bacterium]